MQVDPEREAPTTAGTPVERMARRLCALEWLGSYSLVALGARTQGQVGVFEAPGKYLDQIEKKLLLII
jgi:hypothetical protein